MRFDLHIHTTRYSPDSELDPRRLTTVARDAGLDGVVITEHDHLWSPEEVTELQQSTPGFVVLAGLEVSAREGHFLVYGVSSAMPTWRGIGVADLCEEVHAQGGAVVAAHPFRWGQRMDKILSEARPELDGIELMTKNMDAECRRRAISLLETASLAGLGSSDAHHEGEVGICYTDFEAAIATSADLVQAIRARRAHACERSWTDGRSE